MKTTAKKTTRQISVPDEQKQTFEEAVSGLEKIISVLECEDLTLDDALINFEQGIRLVRVCDDRLKTARGRILELVRGENGELVEKVLGQTLESFLDGEEHDE